MNVSIANLETIINVTNMSIINTETNINYYSDNLLTETSKIPASNWRDVYSILKIRSVIKDISYNFSNAINKAKNKIVKEQIFIEKNKKKNISDHTIIFTKSDFWKNFNDNLHKSILFNTNYKSKLKIVDTEIQNMSSRKKVNKITVDKFISQNLDYNGTSIETIIQKTVNLTTINFQKLMSQFRPRETPTTETISLINDIVSQNNVEILSKLDYVHQILTNELMDGVDEIQQNTQEEDKYPEDENMSEYDEFNISTHINQQDSLDNIKLAVTNVLEELSIEDKLSEITTTLETIHDKFNIIEIINSNEATTSMFKDANTYIQNIDHRLEDLEKSQKHEYKSALEASDLRYAEFIQTLLKNEMANITEIFTNQTTNANQSVNILKNIEQEIINNLVSVNVKHEKVLSNAYSELLTIVDFVNEQKASTKNYQMAVAELQAYINKVTDFDYIQTFIANKITNSIMQTVNEKWHNFALESTQYQIREMRDMIRDVMTSVDKYRKDSLIEASTIFTNVAANVEMKLNELLPEKLSAIEATIQSDKSKLEDKIDALYKSNLLIGTALENIPNLEVLNTISDTIHKKFRKLDLLDKKLTGLFNQLDVTLDTKLVVLETGISNKISVLTNENKTTAQRIKDVETSNVQTAAHITIITNKIHDVLISLNAEVNNNLKELYGNDKRTHQILNNLKENEKLEAVNIKEIQESVKLITEKLIDLDNISVKVNKLETINKKLDDLDESMSLTDQQVTLANIRTGINEITETQMNMKGELNDLTETQRKFIKRMNDSIELNVEQIQPFSTISTKKRRHL